MDSRRLPKGNRLPGRDRMFLDVYAENIQRDVDTLIGKVGDSIRLLRQPEAPSKTADKVGNIATKGRHGGKRQLQPEDIVNSKEISGRDEEVVRPEDPYDFSIPAIVDLSPTEEIRMQYGYAAEDVGTAYIATQFLQSRGIEINPSTDYFQYKKQTYKVRAADDLVNFLDKVQVQVFVMRKSI